MNKFINWKIFFILLSLSLISVACVFPYILTIQGDLIRKTGIPIGLLFIVQLIQASILFSITIILGLWFSHKIQFQLPLLEAIVKKGDYQKVLREILGLSIVMGILTAVAIYLLDPLFTSQGVGISTHQNLAPAWQKLLAAVYGGVTEEIVMRLFLMAMFIWLGMKLFKRTHPTSLGIWIAMVLAAIIFGLGHLPITASITELNALVISRAIVLNGIGGMVFGWLFWKKGLESAMIAHFTADIFLLTLLPLMFT